MKKYTLHEKGKLITTLLDLSTFIRPGKPESIVINFGKELMRRFGLTYFEAEVPIINFKVRIPEVAECNQPVEYVGSTIRLRFEGDIRDIHIKALRPLFEELDDILAHTIFHDVLTKMLEFSQDIIFVVDENGRVVEMNKKARETFGSVEKLPEALDKDICDCGGKTYSIAAYDLGNLKVVVGRDITEIKRLEESAREGEERFRRLAEAVPVAVFAYQKDGLIFVNKAAEYLTGYSRDELIREAFWNIFPEEEVEKVKRAMKSRLRGEVVEPYKLKIRRKDGSERIVRVHGTTISWNRERTGIATLLDITDLEEERRKLEELSKMLSLINRILRHDVLNAITSAVGYLELYKETRDESLLEKVAISLERCANVVRTMKSFEEMVSEGKLRIVNVGKIAEDVAKSFVIPVNIEGDCEVVADEGLRAVIENIVQNAIQHGKTDRVDIRISRVHDYCEIRIADYGKGIPDEIKSRIFEEGFTYGESAGTGMGLYIAERIVERYGGKIWVEDNEPQGTTFVIRLKSP
ncbi:PAS domain S-box protein [Archaeoglobus profundus]|uniref:histidine kinase n=1 Tax=Archaeoglobus profundus (strain DSM 5631 / JCM 9629 / NBRC 100127 / Av18) TaxID=572546 RepID=D2RHB4_ARCPA|nr:PAS domain S-box protein [Archaeoglobus profundus]ADB57689.1 PAS/PAC sensor signal transduction histidine kinase [Archaeoglobus profundus DSM 5631]